MLTAVAVIGGEGFTTEPRPGSPGKRRSKGGPSTEIHTAYFRPESAL